MKIKTDFVTNSSSTSYVLRSTVSGILPRLSGNYAMLKDFYEHQEFLYEHYAHIHIDKSEEEHDLYEEPCYSIDLAIKDGYYYDEDENDDGRAVTFFDLKIELYNPYDHDQEKIVKGIIETLLFKQLGEKITASQLSYFAFPSSISGDGWDGGDPGGPSHKYTYRHDLYKHETKMGIFTIVNSKIITEVANMTQQLSLNEMALNHMNDRGLGLEEQNDKNS